MTASGRAIAEGLPTLEEMASMGFTPEDYADDYFEVWPENWPAVRLFSSIGNQWRIGMGGPTALDYGVLFHRMDRMNLTPDEYEQMFADVQAIESAALAVINKKKAS